MRWPTAVLERLGCTPADLTREGSGRRLGRADGRRRSRGAGQGTGGRHADAARTSWRNWPAPAAIPARTCPPPVFKQGVLKLEDLAPGMELTGTVLNVVDFGCFVDIGMHDSGLVHVSRLADRFIRDPHEVVAVGDIVKVWVMEVDKERRRVSLTMVRPVRSAAVRPAGREAGRRRVGRTRRWRCPAATNGRNAPSTSGRKGKRPGERADRRRVPEAVRTGSPAPPSGPHDRPPPKTRPKVFVPITDGMKTGKEPMRTFGDPAQFFGHNRGPEGKGVKSESGQQGRPRRGMRASRRRPADAETVPQPPQETATTPAEAAEGTSQQP